MKNWNSLFFVSILLLAGCREPNAPLPASNLAAGSGPGDAQSAAEVEPPAAQVQAGSGVIKGIDVAKPSDRSYCNIESVGANAFVAGPLAVAPAQKVHGWLGHSTAAAIGSPVLVLLGEHGVAAGIALQLSMVREDVVNAYGGRAELRDSGFEAALPDVPAGTYKLLLHYIVDGKPYRCDNGRQVTFDK